MTDRFTVRTVVVGLTVGVLVGLGAMAYLAFTSTAIPDQLDRLITFLAGALTSVLVKTGHDGPADVHVMNPPTDPVPVDAEAGHADIASVCLIVIVILLVLWAAGVVPR